MVWEPAVFEPVMVEDAVAVEEPPVLVEDPAVIAPVAPGQTAAVGNVTLALDSSLVSKLSQSPVACRRVSRLQGTGLTRRRSFEQLGPLLDCVSTHFVLR